MFAFFERLSWPGAFALCFCVAVAAGMLAFFAVMITMAIEGRLKKEKPVKPAKQIREDAH